MHSDVKLLILLTGVGAAFGVGIDLISRDTCIKGGGAWKFPFGPCTCPTGQTWDHTQKKCVSTQGANTTAQQACLNSGGTWNGTCTCPSGMTLDPSTGQCVVQSVALPEPTGFDLGVPDTAGGPNVPCTARWDPVSEMVSGDYYSLQITDTTANKQLVSVKVTMGTTSYQYTAPDAHHLDGQVAACEGA